MRILISCLGSYGDIHPFLGMAKTLRARGHHLVIIAPAMYRPLVEQLGFEFVGLGTIEEFDRLADNPDLWHPLRGMRVMAEGVLEMLGGYYDAIVSRYVPGETISVISSLALGGRIAQDRYGIPTVSVHLSPSVMRSIVQPPKLAGAPLRAWQPDWFKRFFYEVVDEFFLDRMMAGGINEFRAGVGLGPVEKIFTEWMHSPRRILGLFPPWFAPMPPDWPPQMRLTGFPLYDEADVTALNPALEDFLKKGDAPIAFTPGSAMRHARDFFTDAVDVCGRLGRRGLLVSRHRENLPPNLPDGILPVEYAPFSTLLPRCAAVVHHGGIGTVSQSLAAGIPQLVMPLGFDQFDNAERLIKLGVARSLPAARFTAAGAAAALEELLRSPAIAVAARRAKDRSENSNAMEQTARWIEQAI